MLKHIFIFTKKVIKFDLAWVNDKNKKQMPEKKFSILEECKFN